MDKVEAANSKQMKSKKKQPLKVVYITNPIKFTATASEFRTLVQELTGQDADVSGSSRFAVAKESSAGGTVHAKGSFEYGGIFTPESMGIHDFQGFAAYPWNEDVHLDF